MLGKILIYIHCCENILLTGVKPSLHTAVKQNLHRLTEHAPPFSLCTAVQNHTWFFAISKITSPGSFSFYTLLCVQYIHTLIHTLETYTKNIKDGG